ncbi:c-type cytochrome [Luteimonas terricola]|uniref:Cytochrome c n=1 Tax=Luteimonas terricola TaxID=645597 RepID=A0ABQ2E4T5_9GAMM|nr:c-type cytochrome [Luteimonas terricola]GGJ95758.1 cytochrome c [Luteimonas terricola]
MRNYDLDFLKRFSLIIGFLAVVTFGLIVLSYFVHKSLPGEVDPGVATRTAHRIAPIGAVYAGDTGAAAQAVAAAAAVASAAAQVAYGGTLDGSVIYGNLCAGCHTAGVAGSPKMERADWTARIAQGTETLHRHAIEGFTGSTGMMPAKGGNPALTDEQVIATVDWMLENLQ